MVGESMKKTQKLIFILVMLVLFGSQSLFAQMKKSQYLVKSGYVEYNLTGDAKGSRKMWWDNWGQRTRTEEKSVTETTVFGIKSKEEKNTVSITVNDQFWTADLTKKTGQKGTIPMYNEIKEYGESMSEAEAKRLEKEILDSFNGERLPNEMFMGYDCEVVTMMGFKVWVHKGVLLKSEGSMMGITLKEEAVIFEKNKGVANSMFEPLKNIKYEEIPDYSAEMTEGSSSAEFSLSFDQFQTVINAFNYDKYKKTSCTSEDESYTASFLKGFMNVLNITAQSITAYEQEELANFEMITHNGNTCYFSDGQGMPGAMLIVLYPKHKMSLTIHTLPGRAKQDLLNMADQLKF